MTGHISADHDSEAPKATAAWSWLVPWIPSERTERQNSTT